MSAAAVWEESREEEEEESMRGGGDTRTAEGDKWRDVGCQWEEPDEGEEPAGGGATREVGCQSEGGGVITRDAAVQVDLLNNTEVSVQCVMVKQKRKRGRPRKYPPVCPPVSPSLPPSPLEEEEEEEEEETGAGMRDEGGEEEEEVMGGGGEEEERRGGVEDDSDPTWRPVHLKHHRVIGRKVIRSYRQSRYIKVEEGEEPDEEEEEPGGGGGARKRKRRGGRRSNAAMEEEEEPGDQDEDEDEDHVNKRGSSGVVCEVCGKVMSCRTNLARHAITHTGQQPFPCPVCGQRFNRYSNAQSHMRRMHSEAGPRPRGRRKEQRSSGADGDGNSASSWLCEMCGKSFNCHSRLRIHVMGHNGVKPYACHLCPKAYVSAADLHKHTRKVHEEGTSVRYSGGPLLCDRCGREFKCRSLLVAHYRTHTGERPFHCDLCTLKFARPHLLRRHKANIHAEGRSRVRSEVNPEEERPFVCQVCGKRLKTMVQLESHVRVHTDERPHSCSVCLRGFSSSRTLRQHQLTVHAEGAERRTPTRKTANDARKAEKEEPETPSPYVCPTCGRDFKFRSTLALHSVTHTKERPHACDLCPQRFGLLGHLKRHREDVHPDGKAGPKEARNFSCPICCKNFRNSRVRLERHMTSAHHNQGGGAAQCQPLPAHEDNDVGTIIMVTVPGNENQDAPPEEDVAQRDANGVAESDDRTTQDDVTPPDADADTNTHDDTTVVPVTPPDVHNDPQDTTTTPVTAFDGVDGEVTPSDGETTLIAVTAASDVTPLDPHHHHHQAVAVLTPHDDHDLLHTHHHVVAVTQDAVVGYHSQMIQVTLPADGDSAQQMMAVAAGQSAGDEAGYAHIMEEAVTQPDMMEVIAPPDMMEVAPPDGYAQETVIEVTQPDDGGAAGEAEEVFVPPPT